MNDYINMYTDGACSGNQEKSNFGGWGTFLEMGDYTKKLYGGQPDTTNNRMELMGVIQGFKALKKDGLKIRVFTDSSYVANCFLNKWYVSWQKNGWKNANKKPVENKELWLELIQLVSKHNVEFYRVKGHVNLNSKSTNLDKLYEKFLANNNSTSENFSFDDFKHIIEGNNIVDALAVKGADEVKKGE